MSIRNSGLRNRKLTGRCSSDTGYFAQHQVHYMLAKYSLRWGFYRAAAVLCRAPCYHSIREVVNPAKDSKLDEVAARHQIDPDKFKRIGRKLRRVWPLLP